MPQLSIRLPDDLVQLLDERASSADHLTRTDITAAALRAYLGVVPAPAAGDKLDRMIELLEVIAGITQPTEPKPQGMIATQKVKKIKFAQSNPAYKTLDVAMSSLSARKLSLEDTAEQLNKMGLRTVTGKEWTRSRVNDYRMKMRRQGQL
jgi:hypothetical protein